MTGSRALIQAAGVALLLQGAAAFTARADNLGPVVTYEKTAHGIAGRTATAAFSVDV